MEFKKYNNNYNSNYNRSNSGGYNNSNVGYNRYNNDKKKDFGPRRNEYIRLPEVRVIDDEGNNLGIMKTEEALALARQKGLDLVEVGPTVRPSVCKIIDYAKYQYELSKKQRKSRAKTREMKEFRFSPVIDKGDVETRVRRAKDFLAKGHNVRLTMRKKGRQTLDMAKQVFEDILTNFEGYSTIEPEKKIEGRDIFITFKADGKIKNKQNSDQESKDDQPKGEQAS